MKTSKKKQGGEQEKKEGKKDNESERTENIIAISVFILLIIIIGGVLTKGFGLLGEDDDNNAKRINVPIGNDPFKGNPKGGVVIVAFSGYECSFCKDAEQSMKRILDKYAENVVYIFKDYPLTKTHPHAYNASLAAECAKEQHKYWEYHDYLYEHNNQLETRYLEEYARLLGLNTEQFNECLRTQRYKSEIEKDIQTAMLVGVTGTPTFFINGIKVIGAQPEEEFIKIINSELKANK